jgi:capsular polysaccharide export protein
MTYDSSDLDEKYTNDSTHNYYIYPILRDCHIQAKLLVIRNKKTIVPLENLLNYSEEIYFMDDDLLDFRVLGGLPIKYAFKLFINSFPWSIIHKRPEKILFVSTPYLAKKYFFLNPHLLLPIASGDMLIRARNSKRKYDGTRICYHGTWSHKNEIKWLVPVIREVQSRCPNTIFEIIGGERVAKLFRDIPRVEVLDTMPWPQYLEHTSNVHQDIGLAPLMDTLFNRGRGPIKFFDYARAGAVGIYSNGPAFGDFVDDGVDGFLLDNDPQLWVEKIIELVNNPELRQLMADKAWEKVLDNSPTSQGVQTISMAFKPKLLFLSSGIAKLPELASFFPQFEIEHLSFFKGAHSSLLTAQNSFHASNKTNLDDISTSILIATWGNKPSARKAEKLAQQFHLPLVRLEDGFLRSVQPGSLSPLSLILDQTGIYYDATAPSDLEYAIATPLTSSQIERTQKIALQWQVQSVSKYNHSSDISDADLDQLTQRKPFLLLIDQTYGDASVQYGQASEHSFEQMLASALVHRDSPKILIKFHPEVVAGKKRGYLSELLQKSQYAHYPQIQVIDWDVHLPSLLTKASAVYTVTSQSGFEGLIYGIPVYTFGMPFYAGWGLTTDKLPAPSRRSSATLSQLIYGALVSYPRYLDPHTLELTEVENTIAYLGMQRKLAQRFSGAVKALGFSPNKLALLKRFTQGASWNSKSQSPSQEINSKCATQFIWGAQQQSYTHTATETGPTSDVVVRVEDGFIRSVGLGASLSTPYSWVFDRTGMYYDATRPSDLETYLQNHTFTKDEEGRAQELQNLLDELGISKYNLDLPTKTKSEVHLPAHDVLGNQIKLERGVGRPIALVIGQVETDASIRLGSIDIRTNLQLVKVVKDQFPNAFLIYKTHPDVQAGLRKGNQDHAQITTLCDALDTEHTLPELLVQVDAVHTISSLSGFEALLRNIPVYCYGLPFYAGWGLTTDRHACSRRTRKLTMPQLVYGALIHYPTYLHPKTGAYCTPEDLCRALDHVRAEQNQYVGIARPLLPRISQELTLRAMQIYHRLRGL